MFTPLEKISLKQLCTQPIMFDANIFMVGIENRGSDPNCSFENMKDLYLTPLFESFTQIYIHQTVYDELDPQARDLVDTYKAKNVTIVDEDNLYSVDPQYTTTFNHIAGHERVQYVRGNSKDKGEVFSLAYAAHHGINYFSSKEIMVDDIARDLEELKEIAIITFDVIVLLAYVLLYESRGYFKKQGFKVNL